MFDENINKSENNENQFISNNGHTNSMIYKHNYQKQGFRDAASVGGKIEAFYISLQKFFTNLMIQAEKNEELNNAKKHEAETALKKIEAEISVHQKAIELIKTGKLEENRARQHEVEEELRKLKQNPDQYIEKEKDPLKYWIYLFVVIFLALFLHIFYSSVIYSAFFREIRPESITRFNSIFFPNVYGTALEISLETLLFVLVGPWIFLALGFLIHTYRDYKGKEKIKYYGLIIFTFVIDSLLAFHISKKMSDIERLNSFQEKKVFTVFDALVDPNFWFVIAFGFFVYLIFGFVLNLFFNERNIRHKYERMIAEKEGHLASLKASETALLNEIERLDGLINDLRLQAAALQNPQDKVYFSPNKLKNVISKYGIGWIQYLENGQYNDEDIISIQNTIEKFYIEKGIKL